MVKLQRKISARREAPHNRAEVKGLCHRACRSRPVKLGAARPGRRWEGWEQPRQRRDGPVPPDGPGPASKTRRCTRGTSGKVHLASGAHLAPPQAQAGELEVAAGPLPPRVAADRRQGGTAPPGSGNGQPLPLPGTAHPLAVVGNSNGTTTNPSARALGRAGCPANGHVRFGRAGWEDDRLARAAPRPSLTLTAVGGR